ncbi:MAG: YicC family protein [Gammaproteobacteria bacterium]|nr:YicC family protein [Gammaproteobacteria bacterium]MDE2249809.1 YicC family protein [Gammaproteobacteria bacterium]
MISSMTGFARLERSGAFGTLVCEIRSVNHRFLDATVRLPDSCRALEADLRHALARELRRGKVDCTIQHRAPVAAVLEVDEAALEPLVARSRELARTIGEQGHVNVLELLRWPGVLREEGADTEALATAAQEIFDAAVAGLGAARAREGQRLAGLILQRCDALAALIAQVRARLPEVLARVRARLEERLAQLGGELNQERIEQEIVLLLHRLDVAEELDRLTGHIEEARRTLAAPEAAGRRLDFLLQEFNREANTLASKSQDLETTRIAVEMKVAIEQMREQVQNIE